jgi:hypothetical protein
MLIGIGIRKPIAKNNYEVGVNAYLYKIGAPV